MTLIIEYSDINNPLSFIHCSKLTNPKPLTNLIAFDNYRHRFRKMRNLLLQNKLYFLTIKTKNYENSCISKKG